MWRQINAALLLAISFAGGCASSNNTTEYTREYLDTKTGVTITALNQPLILAHTEPRISRSLRDYLYIGPVEVNTMGKRSYYLWIGPFSTIDRPPAEINTLTLTADNATTELNFTLANTSAGLKTLPYELPLGTQPGRYLPVAGELLAELAKARAITIETTSEDGKRVYALWRGEIGAFSEFADTVNIRTATNPRPAITSKE